MRPLFPGPNIKKDAIHVATEYSVLKDNNYCSLVKCIVRNG